MKTISLFLLTFFICAFSVFGQNTDIESLLKKSRELRSERKFEEAIAELSKAISVQPKDADLYIRRANLYLLTQNRQNLLADVKQAAALAPTDKKILYYGALTVFKSDQYKESLLLVNNLIALGDADLPALELKVSVLTHLEDFAAAHVEVTRLIELYPNEVRLKHNQANLSRLMGDSNAASEGFSEQIALLEARLGKEENKETPNRLEWDLSALYFSRANIYQSRFEVEKMKADLVRAVALHPISMNYERMATFYTKQKMFDEALDALNKGLEKESKGDAGLFMRRGDVYFATQKYAEAIKDYEQVRLLKSGLEELAERRIVQAKQKLQESPNQPR